MASTLTSASGSSVTASASNVTVVPPPAAGQQQQAGFHVAPPAHAHVPMHHQQQTFHLTPQMEEGIKAAVAATNPGPPAPPRKKRSSWTMAKYFLRCATLFACVGMIIAEVIVAITQRAELDTAISVIWGLIYASWHTLRLVGLIRKKGVETITPLSLIIDVLLLITAIICIGLLMWRLIDGGLGGNPEWGYSALQDRGVILLIIISSVGAGQCILFHRARVEYKIAQGSETTSRAEVAPSDHPTPTPPPPPPAQIVVHYVQNTCPKCGTQSWPQPGEDLNEQLASKGDLQPQAIPLSQLQSLPRAAG